MCTHIVEYIYIYIKFIKSLLHVSARTAPSSGSTLDKNSFEQVTRVLLRMEQYAPKHVGQI